MVSVCEPSIAASARASVAVSWSCLHDLPANLDSSLWFWFWVVWFLWGCNLVWSWHYNSNCHLVRGFGSILGVGGVIAILIERLFSMTYCSGFLLPFYLFLLVPVHVFLVATVTHLFCCYFIWAPWQLLKYVICIHFIGKNYPIWKFHLKMYVKVKWL